MHSFIHGQLVHIKVAFVSQSIVEILNSYWTKYGYHVFVPIKIAENFEEFANKLHFSLQRARFRKVVKNVERQSVHAVGCHAGQLRPQQARFVSEPRFQNQNASFEQMVLPDEMLVGVVHEVKGAETTMLADTDI